MNRILVIALSLALAACGETASTSPGAGLSQPAAVAVFDGLTSKTPGEVRPYLAVANAGEDELVLIDPVDDEPVRAPVLVRSLVVPIPDPRPTMIASADLADDVVTGTPPDTTTVRSADLLVVVSSGSTTLQLVQTWGDGVAAGAVGTPSPKVVPEADVDLGAPVLALTAMPVPDPDNGYAATSGRARVIASLPGSRLAVVDYVRQANGSILPAAPTPAFQELSGFEAVSLAWDPADLRHLYAATPDPIPTESGPVEGIAAIDLTGAPGGWTVAAIDARAPTLLVAAWTLRERVTTGDNTTLDTINAFAPDQRRRVYAFVDPTRCGPGARMGCGLAVLDPLTGRPVPDPSGRMPYLAPIFVPGIPTALAISGPPAVGPTDAFQPPLMRVMYGLTPRGTTAVMAVPTTAGAVFYVDLGRWAIPNEHSLLTSSATRTAVTNASFEAITAPDPNAPGRTVLQSLAIWAVVNGEEKRVTDLPRVTVGVKVTPGFTPDETWVVGFRTPLPGLVDRPAETDATDDGRTRVALQVTLPGGRVTQVARVYDPALGVRVGPFGDVLFMRTAGLSGTGEDGQPATCPDEIEVPAAEFVLPDAARPGGAVVLGPPTCAAGDAECTANLPAVRNCVAILRAGHRGIPTSVRAAEKIDASGSRAVAVAGATLGYAGRAVMAGGADSPNEFRLEYPRPPVSEDTLAAACPLVPWPWPESFTAEEAPAVPACDASCRATCEALVLARKARRIHHLSEKCPDESESCRAAWRALEYPFPLADGPVVAFRVTLARTVVRNGETTTEHEDRRPAEPLALVLTTRSGISRSFRAPAVASGAAVFPRGAAAFDRSAFANQVSDGYRFFVPYVDGSVLDFSPSQLAGDAELIR